jgi:twinfilin-like protein
LSENLAKHQKHSTQAAPLTQEEEGQAGLREAEAQESGGTTARKGHVGSKLDAITTEDGLEEKLGELMKEGNGGLLVQLVSLHWGQCSRGDDKHKTNNARQYFNLPDETLRVDSSTPSVSPAQLASTLSQTDPRFSFYSYPGSTTQIVYMYTCPTASKVKQRMMYSTSKRFVQMIAEQKAGVVVAKSLEATEFEDLSEQALAQEFGGEDKAEKKTFSRPKRPGRRWTVMKSCLHSKDNDRHVDQACI